MTGKLAVVDSLPAINSVLQIQFSNFTLGAADVAAPKVKFHGMDGSVNSADGTIVAVSCTSMGDGLAFVFCDTVKFPIFCREEFKIQRQILHFQEQYVRQKCIVHFASGNSSLVITGALRSFGKPSFMIFLSFLVHSSQSLAIAYYFAASVVGFILSVKIFRKLYECVKVPNAPVIVLICVSWLPHSASSTVSGVLLKNHLIMVPFPVMPNHRAGYDSPTQCGDYDDYSDSWDRYDYGDETDTDSDRDRHDRDSLHEWNERCSPSFQPPRSDSSVSFSVLSADFPPLGSQSPEPIGDSVFSPVTPSNGLEEPSAPLPSLHEWFMTGQPLYSILTLPANDTNDSPPANETNDSLPANDTNYSPPANYFLY